jgi:flagella basal body P-ring formation protein FlgA
MRRLVQAGLAAALLAAAPAAGQAAEQITAVVPKAHVQPGQTLTRGMLERRQVRAPAYDRLVRRIERAAGREAARLLRAGQPIPADRLRAPTLVRRGQRVNVVYRAGTVRLSTIGKARERGAKGDVIDVMVLETRQSLAATVVGSGTVRFGPGS